MLATPANQTSSSTDLSQSRLTLECRLSDVAPLLLTLGKWTIGSGCDNSLAIDADGVAKRHCLIVASEKRTLLKSWQPDTFVNGEAVTDTQIQHGDRIRIGTVEFDVRSAGDAELISQLPCVTQVEPAGSGTNNSDDDSPISDNHSTDDHAHSDRTEFDRASAESLTGRVDDLLEVTAGLADELAGADVDEERLDVVIDRIQSSLRAEGPDDRSRNPNQADESGAFEDSTPRDVDSRYEDHSVSEIAHELSQLRDSIHSLLEDCGIDPSSRLVDRVETESTAASDVRLCIALLQECTDSLKSRSETVETSSTEVENEQNAPVSEQPGFNLPELPECADEPEARGSLFESIMSAEHVEAEPADEDTGDDYGRDDSISSLIDDADAEPGDHRLEPEVDKGSPDSPGQNDLSASNADDSGHDDRLFSSDRQKLQDLMEQFELDSTADELEDTQIDEEEEAVAVGAASLLADNTVENALRSRSEAVRQLDELVLAATAGVTDESTVSDGSGFVGVDRFKESGQLNDEPSEQTTESVESEEATEEDVTNEPANEYVESIASVADDQAAATSMIDVDESVDAGIETVDEVPWSIQSATDTWTEGASSSAEIDEHISAAEIDQPGNLDGYDQWAEETSADEPLDSFDADEPPAIDSPNIEAVAATPAGESSLLASLFRPETSDEQNEAADEASTEEPADQPYLTDEDDYPSMNLVRSQLAEMFDLPDTNDSGSLLGDPTSERSLDERFESFFEGCESSSRESDDDSQSDGRYLSSSMTTPEGSSGSKADDPNDMDPEMSSYMEQLLARSRKKAGLDSSAVATPDEQTEPQPVSTNDPPSIDEHESSGSEFVPGQPAEWFAQEPRHRQNKEQIRAEVLALREVANDSARAAVGSATRRGLRVQVLAKTGATVAALGCGLGALALELPLLFAYFVIGLGVLFTADLARTIIANWSMISKLDLMSGNLVTSSTSSKHDNETTDQAD